MEIYAAIPKDVVTGKTRRIGKNHPTALWVFTGDNIERGGMAYHDWEGIWLNHRIRRVKTFARCLSEIGHVLCRVSEPAVGERTPKISVCHTRFVPLSQNYTLNHPDYGADEINPVIIRRDGGCFSLGSGPPFNRRFFLEPVFSF